MAWRYHFVNLTEAQKLSRRHLLDRYGTYALISTVLPVLAFQLYCLICWASDARQRSVSGYTAVPGSPRLKKLRHTSARRFACKFGQIKWWLKSDIVDGCGSRGHIGAAVLWTCWLSFLCIAQTGNDYLHLTKRVGVVAASQFPIVYMLNMKSCASPMALAFRASHEELKPYHQMLGRIMYSGFFIHGTLYLNYFIQVGVLLKRLKDRDVIVGTAGLLLLSTLMCTTLEKIRRFNYRIFFLFHLIIGIAIFPVLFFHVTHLRIYIFMSLTLFILDTVGRKLDTITAFSRITSNTNSDLVKITIPIPKDKIHRFRVAVAQHVYLNLPLESSSSPINRILYNPFTIAQVHSETISVFVRPLKGPVTNDLSNLTKLTKATPPLNIEGPYGSSTHFPDFAKGFDRVLLIAGGVGASFISPFYNQIKGNFEAKHRQPRKIEFIWSIRQISDIVALLGESGAGAALSDRRIRLFVTANTHDRGDMEGHEMNVLPDSKTSIEFGRPDLRLIVDDIFSSGKSEKIAVLVCGPKAMGRDVRSFLSSWVSKGRHVWFHNEKFGW